MKKMGTTKVKPVEVFFKSLLSMNLAVRIPKTQLPTTQQSYYCFCCYCSAITDKDITTDNDNNKNNSNNNNKNY